MREAEAELDTLRQFITENVVLSAAGAVLGLWLARAGVLLMRTYPASLPRTSEVM